MQELEILGVPQSNFVRAVRMAFEEKGVPYALNPLPPHAPEVSEIHPLGKVPALRHGEVTVGESRAIVAYLDALYPENPVVPREPGEAAAAEQWISLVGNAFDRTMVREYCLNYIFPKGADGQPDRAAIEAAVPQMQAQLRVLDAAVAKSDCLAGDRFTFADMLLMPILDNVRRFPEGAEAMAGLPALSAYYERHAARPCFQAANPPRA